MTSLWGPLGWMTLHSVSFLYPERPSDADKALLKRFMVLFRDTITCPHCYQHFKVIFENYTKAHPEWASSRFDFFMFVCRAHNTVNRRLNKPQPDSVSACIQRFTDNTKVTSALTYRMKYLDYLTRNYGMELSGDNMMKIASVREMRKIMNEYWNTLTDTGTATFRMDADVLDYINESPSTRQIMTSGGTLSTISASPAMRVGLQGGRFRLRNG